MAIPSTAFPTSLPVTPSCLEAIVSAEGIGKVHISSCAWSFIPKALQAFHNEVTSAGTGTMDHMMTAKRRNPVDGN